MEWKVIFQCNFAASLSLFLCLFPSLSLCRKNRGSEEKPIYITDILVSMMTNLRVEEFAIFPFVTRFHGARRFGEYQICIAVCISLLRFILCRTFNIIWISCSRSHGLLVVRHLHCTQNISFSFNFSAIFRSERKWLIMSNKNMHQGWLRNGYYYYRCHAFLSCSLLLIVRIAQARISTMVLNAEAFII